MIDADTAQWLLAAQAWQRDYAATLVAVMERILAGEPVILNCRGCGERLGVYSVYAQATHCRACEQAASERPAAQVHAA